MTTTVFGPAAPAGTPRACFSLPPGSTPPGFARPTPTSADDRRFGPVDDDQVAANLGSAQQRRLDRLDARVHRCSCGSWAYGDRPCTTCQLLSVQAVAR